MGYTYILTINLINVLDWILLVDTELKNVIERELCLWCPIIYALIWIKWQKRQQMVQWQETLITFYVTCSVMKCIYCTYLFNTTYFLHTEWISGSFTVPISRNFTLSMPTPIHFHAMNLSINLYITSFWGFSSCLLKATVINHDMWRNLANFELILI